MLDGIAGGAWAQATTSAAIAGRILDNQGRGLQGVEVVVPTGASLATTSQIPLLSQTGQTTGPGAQPIYRFDSTMRWYSDENFDTYYQLQFAVRYNF
jgi:hypothetical protein